jgi:curved DNA-binding protein CbpA
MFYPNPYQVLEVSKGASKTEINQAFKKAMKDKKYPLAVISKAHKCLLDSQQRLIADYLQPYLPTIHRFKHQDLSLLEQPEPILEILPEFDLLDETIALNKEVSEDDKMLGENRFTL